MTQFGTYWTSLEINEPFILECRESNIIFGSQKKQSLSNCSLLRYWAVDGPHVSCGNQNLQKPASNPAFHQTHLGDTDI